MATIMDGKALSQKLKEQMKERIAQMRAEGIIPKLVVVLVGNDSARKFMFATNINPAAKLELNRRLFTSLKKQHRKNFWIPYISLTKIQQWTEFWFSFRFQNRSTKKLCCVQSFRKRMWTASILSA